ncbi:MAG: hypothetical protein ABI634_13190 [Acidobacteriota bacterium]
MRRALRTFVGPVVLATGIWCAAGVVALPSADALSTRVVSLPAWWLFIATLGAAWLVPSYRKAPSLATPALLSVLPWLPIPLPTFLLIWTGRLAWVPIGLSLVAMARSLRPPSAGSLGERASDHLPRRQVISAALLTAVALMATAWAIAPRLPGGDEPHYLIITQSLLEDGDLQIENNHQARDYASYFSGTLNPDFLRRGRDEIIYSIHAPGLPLIVAPLFAVFGYPGAQATLMLCGMVTGALIWACAWIATRSASAAWFAWAAIASSLTFLVQGVSIFPDGPAGTIVAASTLVLLRLERRWVVSRRTLVALSATLAWLPFLHTRLATVSAGIGAAVLWYLATEAQRSAADRRGRILAFFVVPAVGFVAWLGYFQILYGTPNPAVAYGSHPETRLAYVPGGVLGLLFDQDFGLFAFAPVLAAAVVGWLRRDQAVATGRSVLGATVLCLAAVGTYWMWWGGLPATPARFAAAILPALAPGLAGAWWRSGRTGRTVLSALVVLTTVLSVALLGVGRGTLAWNTYDAHVPWLSWLGTSTDLARGLPSFFWDLDPGVVASEWPFVVHVLALLSVILVLSLVTRAIARRSRAPEVLGSWVVAAGLMACAQLGWWITQAPSLQPMGSQVRMLDRIVRGAPARVLSPSQPFGRPADPRDLVIEVPHARLATSPTTSWISVPALPPGDYLLTITERRPVGGSLTMRVGEGLEPQMFGLAHQTEQTIVLPFQSGVSGLVFEPDAVLGAAGPQLVLRKR